LARSSDKQQFLAGLQSGQYPQYAQYTPAYAWRIERGSRRGLTRSQARGHARRSKGEQPVSVLNTRLTRGQYQAFSKGTAWLSYDANSVEEVEFIIRNADRGNANRMFVEVHFQLKDGSGSASKNSEPVWMRNRSDDRIVSNVFTKISNLLSGYKVKRGTVSYTVIFAGKAG
jgi:hypothetical protein